MSRRRRFLDRNPRDARLVPLQQLGRPKAAREEDRARPRDRCRGSSQFVQQPARHILEVSQPLAQHRISDATHAIMHLGCHPLNRGGRGQPTPHRIRYPVKPAGIRGDQPVGLDDLP